MWEVIEMCDVTAVCKHWKYKGTVFIVIFVDICLVV